MNRLVILLVLFSFQALSFSASAEEPKQLAKDAGKLAKASTRLVTKQSRLRAVPGFSSPKKLFKWMKSNLVFEPYEGALRGPEGTLISGGGNSVDIALLAAKELKDRKFKVRFERVPWNKKAKKNALSAFVGKATILMKGDPPTTVTNWSGFPEDRVFVSVFHKGRWNAFDVVGSPTYGVAPKSQESLDELPFSTLGSFRFKATVKLDDGQKRTLFDYKVPIHVLSQSGWSLSFSPQIGREDSIVPMFAAGGEVKRADDFPADSVELISLDISLRQSGLERRETHTLFDQKWGKRINELWPVFSLHAFGSWIDFDWSRAQAAGRLLSSANGLQAWAGERISGMSQNDPKGIGLLAAARTPLHHAVALNYVGTLDHVTLDLAHTMGVQPMISQPRVLLIASTITKDGTEFRIDPALGAFGAISKRGIPGRTTIGFRSMLGTVESVVRHEVENVFGGTGKPWFANANNAIVTIDGTGFRKKLKPLSDSKKMFIKQRVGLDGNLLLSSNPIESSPGWWMLSPESGEMNEATPEAFAPLFQSTRSEAPAKEILKTGQKALKLFSSPKAVVNKKRAVCTSAKHLRFASQAYCASGKPVGLPSLETCLKPYKMDSATFERKGCIKRTKDFRCGAVISEALLKGKLTVLYPAGETPFEILSPSKKKKKKKTKTVGITCK